MGRSTFIALLLFILFPVSSIASQQTIENAVTFGTNRTRINANFTELYTQAFDAMIVDIVALTDPNDDRLMFWDDSSGGIVWLDIGTGLTITDTTMTSAGGGGTVDISGTPIALDIARWTDSDTIEGITYAALKAALDLEIGTDVQAYDANLPTWPSSVDATETGYLDGVTSPIQTQIDTKAPTSNPVFTGSISIAATATGPQLATYQEDSDLGSNYVGVGSPASNDNDLVLLLPSSDPTAGQLIKFAAPTSVTFSDGTARDAAAGSFVSLVDTECIYIEDPDENDDIQSIWKTKGFTATLTSIWAESDQTVNFDLQVDDGTPADVNGTDISPAAGTAEDTTLSGDTSMADGDRLDLAVTSVSGTPTWVSICWTFNVGL